MSKPLVLTCDIGTQSARALLVDPDGRIVDVVQSKYAEPYFSKEPGWAEQKPNFYFDRLCGIYKMKDFGNATSFSGWISAPLTRTAPCLPKT